MVTLRDIRRSGTVFAATMLAFADPGTHYTFTASPFTAFRGPSVEALLYNPPVDEISWTYPYKPGMTTRRIETRLVIFGKGFDDGRHKLTYKIAAGEETLHQDTVDISVTDHWFEKRITLPRKYPQATRILYEVTSEDRRSLKGCVPLLWSRFQGRAKYLDGRWRSTYIELFPKGFNSVGGFWVPVQDDGRFDALLPARVYPVVNVNGAGYSYDAMERWAWDYDLTRDREDFFTIGRTELYAIHAFDLKAPVNTIFVTFRPTALSRLLQFDEDGDRLTSGDERKKMVAAMKHSPTVIGPELEAKDVTVWLNGREEKIVQFNKIPEYDGNLWQVQYLLQIFPQRRPARGVWHEIKLEVRSTEMLQGKELTDFGQGSVGFYRP